jgi:hypothetical protein
LDCLVCACVLPGYRRTKALFLQCSFLMCGFISLGGHFLRVGLCVCVPGYTEENQKFLVRISAEFDSRTLRYVLTYLVTRFICHVSPRPQQLPTLQDALRTRLAS